MLLNFRKCFKMSITSQTKNAVRPLASNLRGCWGGQVTLGAGGVKLSRKMSTFEKSGIIFDRGILS